IYQDIGPAQLALAHARAAQLLAGAQADSAVVAPHLLAREPSAEPTAARQLRGAAREAWARGVPSRARDYLRRALREPPPREDRAAVLGELAGAEALGGDAAASEHLLEALALTSDP